VEVIGAFIFSNGVTAKKLHSSLGMSIIIAVDMEGMGPYALALRVCRCGLDSFNKKHVNTLYIMVRLISNGAK